MSNRKEMNDFWVRHVGELDKSGLTIGAYARVHSLKRQTLHYWVSKLKPLRESLSTSSGFVPIAIHPQISSLSIRLRINKIICELEGVSINDFKALLVVLGGLQ